MVKVAYGAGHGGKGSTAGKRTPDGEYEWNFNDVVARAFADEMAKYKNVQLLRTDDASGKTDIPLATRTNKANSWGADYYVSFHHNANTGSYGDWTGTEIHVYKSKPTKATKLANLVAPKVAKAYGLRNRGVKFTNLHITRENGENGIVAILVEGGFMDSKIDIKKLRDDKVLKEAGKTVAQALAQFAGLVKAEVAKPKPAVNTTASTHKVVKGDTLYSLSKKYGTTVNELKKLNGLKSDVIVVGKVLKVKAVKSASAPKPQTPSYVGKRVESIHNGSLRFYNKPSWDDKDVVGSITKGFGFPTIISKVNVGGAYQYKVKNSKGNVYYITASSKYVKVV